MKVLRGDTDLVSRIIRHGVINMTTTLAIQDRKAAPTVVLPA
jgi:hypothetical protein